MVTLGYMLKMLDLGIRKASKAWNAINSVYMGEARF
jgi:hypothetical protein